MKLLTFRNYSACGNMQYSFRHIDPFLKEGVTGNDRDVLGKRELHKPLTGKMGLRECGLL